jgi:toxin YoeB
MRNFVFKPIALEQFNYWAIHDKKVHTKILELLQNIMENPFKGIGKPEPLKHSLKGCWSRRINQEHRLVYQITSDSVIVISCKFHY